MVDSDELIKRILREIGEMPPLPDIVAKVLRAAAQERYSAADKRRAAAFEIALRVGQRNELVNFRDIYEQTGIFLPDFNI